MNAKRKVKKSSSNVKKSPQDVDFATAQPSKTKTTVGRAALESLTTACLYMLLKQKNLPNRSKLRTKESRINALEGIISNHDLIAIGVKADIIDVEANVRKHVRELESTRDQIRPGKGKKLGIPVAGIDVHSDVLEVAIANDEGITWRGSFMNANESINDLILAFKSRCIKHVAMESTAEYWLKPYWILHQNGIHVLVANANQVAATQGVKTDKIDAARLALAFRDGRLKPSILCTPLQFKLRKLNRDSIKKTQAATSAITRVKSIMKANDAPSWLMEIQNSERIRRILKRIVRASGKECIFSILQEEYADHRGKILDPDIIATMADAMVEFLSRVNDKGELARLASHFDDYQHNTAASVDFQNEILSFVKNDELLVKKLNLILTLPSVSITTGLTFLVEIMDVKFFWRSEALVKWAGMAPRVNQSGYKKRVTGKIYKGGNKFVRYAAFLVAKVDHAHGRHQGHPVGRFVTHQYKDRGKSYKTAVTAGGAKLLRYLFQVLTLELPFQEIYKVEECEKLKKNRERKLRQLDVQLKSTDLKSVLNSVVERLNDTSDRLDSAIKDQLQMLSEMMLVTVNALAN